MMNLIADLTAFFCQRETWVMIMATFGLPVVLVVLRRLMGKYWALSTGGDCILVMTVAVSMVELLMHRAGYPENTNKLLAAFVECPMGAAVLVWFYHQIRREKGE